MKIKGVTITLADALFLVAGLNSLLLSVAIVCLFFIALPSSFESDQNYYVSSFVKVNVGKMVVAKREGSNNAKYYSVDSNCLSTLPDNFVLPLWLSTTKEKDGEQGFKCAWSDVVAKNFINEVLVNELKVEIGNFNE